MLHLPNRRTSLRWSLILFMSIALLGLGQSFGRDARASHSQSYIFPGAPYSGTWNLGDNAPPSSHHRLWGGNWATDFYQVQYTQAILRFSTNDGTPLATMVRKSNSCLNA